MKRCIRRYVAILNLTVATRPFLGVADIGVLRDVYPSQGARKGETLGAVFSPMVTQVFVEYRLRKGALLKRSSRLGVGACER